MADRDPRPTDQRRSPIEPPPAPPARTLDVRQITVVGIVAFALFTLLNASSLLRIVERQPFGWQRTVQVALVKPPRRPAATSCSSTGPARPPTTPSATSSAATPAPSTTSPPATPRTPPARPALTELRQPTADDPPPPVHRGRLSQAEILGQSVIDRANATGVMDATLDFEFSSGLTCPDFYNWPAEIQRVVETEDPDAMVVVFGANDGQGMELEGGVFQPGDPEWNAEYACRVDAVMTYLEQSGVRVYWIGQPVARDADYTARLELMNQIFADVAADHPNTTIVSLFELFQDESGAHLDYLPGAGASSSTCATATASTSPGRAATAPPTPSSPRSRPTCPTERRPRRPRWRRGRCRRRPPRRRGERRRQLPVPSPPQSSSVTQAASTGGANGTCPGLKPRGW
ncbi:MAG: DUF459 domain-containing protein [Microthrixaceae bacterium]|nr:DUF459 domain-containing protein [Microthrixaceae bacterium]